MSSACSQSIWGPLCGPYAFEQISESDVGPSYRKQSWESDNRQIYLIVSLLVDFIASDLSRPERGQVSVYSNVPGHLPGRTVEPEHALLAGVHAVRGG